MSWFNLRRDFLIFVFLFITVLSADRSYSNTSSCNLALAITRYGSIAVDRPISSKSKSTIGFYFGTFDPIHLGHVDLIKEALASELIDHLVVIPNFLTDHKPQTTDLSDRLQMTRIALKDFEKVSIMTDDGGLSKTIGKEQPIRELIKYAEAVEAVLFIGADSFESLTTSGRKLSDLPFDQIAVWPRDGYEINIPSIDRPKITVINGVDERKLSSTQLRDFLKEGVYPGRDKIDKNVFDYIVSKKLYQDIKEPSRRELAKKISVILDKSKKSASTPLARKPEIYKEPIDQSVSLLENLMREKEGTDPFLYSLFEQVHLILKNAAINAPGGRYAFGPSRRALVRMLEVLNLLKRKTSVDVPSLKGLSSDIYRQQIENIKREDRKFVDSVLMAPESVERALTNRLKKYGINASMPEFEISVRYLKVNLLSENVFRMTSTSPVLERIRLERLKQLKTLEHKKWPYLETLNAFEDTIGFFDVMARGDKNSKHIPFYYAKQWQHYAQALKSIGADFVTIPTISDLSIKDFLKINGLNLGFAGLTAYPSFADSYVQTPLEFWLHDFNHNRRMRQSIFMRANELHMSMQDYTAMTNRFVNGQLVPLITKTSTDSKDIIKQKQVISFLLFESSHEDGLPLDKSLLAETLSRSPADRARFIYENVSSDLTTVAYSYRASGTMLAYIFRKLEGEFIDPIEQRRETIDVELRTRDEILRAAMELNRKLNLSVDEAILKKNVEDDSGIRGPFRDKLELLAKQYPHLISPFNDASGTSRNVLWIADRAEIEGALENQSLEDVP